MSEDLERAKALFFDAINTGPLVESPWWGGYYDREFGTLDGNIDEIMPALLAYGWTPPDVEPLPRMEREVREEPAPVETWTGGNFGPLNEGDVVRVSLGGESKLFKVDKTSGSSLTPGLTKLECTRVDGDAEDISVELQERS